MGKKYVVRSGSGDPSAYSSEINLINPDGTPWTATKAGASGPNIVVNGDSLNAQGGSTGTNPAGYLATYTGRAVYTDAVGGETSTGIAARQGGVPYLLQPVGDSIPASGPVNVVVTTANGVTSWPLLQTNGNTTLGKVFVGVLAGVHGTLSLVQPSGANTTHQADDYYVFTRTTAGTAVSVRRPAAFYQDFTLDHRGDIHVIQAGRNNYSSTDQVLADVAAMVQWLEATDKRYLVVGLHNGTGEGNPSGAYTSITTLNTKLAQAYGRKFLDWRSYVIKYGLEDAGLSVTVNDAADIAADTVPRSLTTDGVHLQLATRQILAKLEAERLQELGWVSSVSVPPVKTLYTDTFDRADNTDLGPLWTPNSSFRITANKLTRTSSTGTPAVLQFAQAAPTPNHRVSVTIDRGTAATTGVVVRMVDTNNYYAARVNQTLNNILIYKVVAGATTTLAGLDNLWTANGSSLTVEINGSTIKASFNGTEVLSANANDAALANGTLVGVRSDSLGATLPTFDNFVVSQI